MIKILDLLKTTMIDINDEAIKKYKLNKNAEALTFLKRAEKTLEVYLFKLDFQYFYTP